MVIELQEGIPKFQKKKSDSTRWDLRDERTNEEDEPKATNEQNQ